MYTFKRCVVAGEPYVPGPDGRLRAVANAGQRFYINDEEVAEDVFLSAWDDHMRRRVWPNN